MKIKRTLVKKGDVVVMKQDVPSQELTAKDIIDTAAQIQNELSKIETQRTQLEQQKEQLEEYDEELKDRMKEVTKFTKWATEVQQSKLKSLVNEVKDEVKEKVDKLYTHDDLLTDEQNIKQKYHQYKHYIGRHEKLAREIHSSILQKSLYESVDLLENPWA